MSETLEQIVLRVAKEIGITSTAGGMTEERERIKEFARRLIAALNAQEPVAWLYTYDGRPHAAGLKPRECWADHEQQPLYAAPQLPREGCEDEGCPHYGTPHSHGTLPKGWQLVPKDYSYSMQQAFMEGEDFNARYKAMLAAAPKPENGK